MAVQKTPDFKVETIFTSSQGGVQFQSVAERIEGIAKLGAGWHYGEGLAVPRNVVDVARRLVWASFIRGHERFDVFPGKYGQISVVIYVGDADHSFQIQPNLSVRYWDEADSDVEEEFLTVAEAIEKIHGFPLIWNSFITFTSDFGIPQKVISEAKHLKPQRTAASQSHAKNAYSIALDVSVSMEESSIKAYAPSLQYFGNLTQEYCLVTAR